MLVGSGAGAGAGAGGQIVEHIGVGDDAPAGLQYTTSGSMLIIVLLLS